MSHHPGAGSAPPAARKLPRMAAVASALLEANGSGWLHAFLPRTPDGDEALTALRSRLGGPAFEAARAYGRSIAGRRAVAYALNRDQTSPPDRDPPVPGPA